MPAGPLLFWQSVSFDSGQELKEDEVDIRLISPVFILELLGGLRRRFLLWSLSQLIVPKLLPI